MTQFQPTGTLQLRLIPQPADTNASGVVSGGWIAHQMDTAATSAVMSATRSPLVTAALPALRFSCAVNVGDQVSVYTSAVQTTDESVSVDVEAWVKPDAARQEQRLTSGTFSYAATQKVAAVTAASVEPVAEPAPAEPVEEEAEANLQDLTNDLIPALRDHLKQCWQETYSAILDQDELDTLKSNIDTDDLGGMLMADARKPQVITLGDKIIGCAMSASRHNITYIWGMYVQKAYQRVGLGHSLIEAILQTLPEKGMVELTVLKTSEPALNFYTSIGFKSHRSGDLEFVPGKTMEAANMYAKVQTLRG